MAGVYGNFVTCFPELFETLTVWSEYKGDDERLVRAIFSPSKGIAADRKHGGRQNPWNDIAGDDHVFVKITYKHKIGIGDWFYRQGGTQIYRVTGEAPYSKAADYIDLTVEPVSGDTKDDTESLGVKEGRFA